MEMEEFLSRISNLKLDKARGPEKPYKPLLLLAVISLIQEGKISDRDIYPDEVLKNKFQQLLQRFYPDWNYKADFRYPFRHLETDGVWTLEPKAGQSTRLAELREAKAKARDIMKAVGYARFDVDIFETLAASPEKRSEVASLILRKYLGAQPEAEDDLEPVRRRSQGRGLSPGKRKAIEEWAVDRAKKKFSEFTLEDVGSTKSWDLEDDTSSPPVRIEVKGSTLSLDKITLTDNEVEHAKQARDEGNCRLILVVVEKIELDAGDGEDKWIASGGEVRVSDPWGIDDGGLEPTQWRYRLGDMVRST